MHSESHADAITTQTITPQQVVIGIDIGGTNLRLALADLTGKILTCWSTKTADIFDPADMVQSICIGVNVLLTDPSLAQSKLVALAVGAPGITDAHRGIVIATSYLGGWRDVPLRALLEEALHVPVFVDNDGNMAAFGEYSAGVARTMRDFVFLAVGTGLGAGIMIDGKVHRGVNWLAGEVGYMLVPGTTADPVQNDSPGALEELVGGEGIRQHWRATWKADTTSLNHDASATDIFDAAALGDSLSRSTLDSVARALAYAIYNMALVLNCSHIVLGGSLGLHPGLQAATGAVLQKLNPRVQPTLISSALGGEAQIHGAIHQAIAMARPNPL
jgi:glucokinase